MKKVWTWFARLAFMIVVVTVSASSLWAQSASTGGLTGTVTDPSGAVIPNATVNLVSSATGQTLTAKTNAQGTYRFSLLSPGAYQITVSAAGFGVYEVPSVTVNVTALTVINAKLAIGTSTQNVEVSGSAAAILETQTAAEGTLLDSRSLQDIPLTTRNYTQVISLSAGVTSAVYNAGTLGRGSVDSNVNGQSTSSNNYEVNGGDGNQWVNDTTGGGGTSLNGTGGMPIPNPDAIQEFEIQTSQYDAEYGRNPGASVNLVTKSGTNSFHGSLFEFNRNDIFNANSYFLNAAGEPKAVMKQNQFGGTFGGPIKKDKLFFFFAYQGTRQLNGLDTSALSTDIEPPLTNDRSAATIGSEFCPANKPAATQSLYDTFAGGVQVACDGSNINPVALNLLQLKLPDGTYVFPTPQQITTSASGASLGSSTYSVPSSYIENQFMGNVDYVMSSRNTLSEKYFYDRVPELESFAPDTAGYPAVPGTPGSFESRDTLTDVKLTSTLTSNVVNEAMISYTRNSITSTAEGVPLASSIGMTQPADIFYPLTPGIVIAGSLGSYDVLGGTGVGFYGVTEQYQIGENLSWIHKKNSIRMGAAVEKTYWHADLEGRSKGLLTFENFTDFLLGQNAAQNGSPSGLGNIYNIASGGGGGAQEGTDPKGGINVRMVSFPGDAFIQDDYKVNKRLTLNLGLRWEYIPANYNTEGETGAFNYADAATLPVPPLSGTLIGNTVAANYKPNEVNPYTGLPFGPPPTGVIQRTTKALFENTTPLNNFAPRFGFAWQPGSSQSRLVIRGGYGWFYATQGGNGIDSAGLTQPPQNQRFFGSGVAANSATLVAPYPVATLGYIPRTPTSKLSDAAGGPLLASSTVDEFSLGTQYSVWPTVVLEVGYVGSRGVHLSRTDVLNQSLIAGPSNPINCAYECITTNTSANAVLRVPIMGESPTSLTHEDDFNGNSWYNGLQVTLRKGFSHGLTFQGAYTWSKAEADTTVDNDQTMLNQDWFRVSTDITNRLVVNYIYNLPTPHVAGFGNATKAVLGGWTVSGITIAQTGLPITLTDSKGGTIYGSAGTSTALLCPGASVGQIKTSGGNDRARRKDWFNPAVFYDGTGSTCGSFPNSPFGSGTGYGNTGQNIVDGPGQFNWDIAMAKTMVVGGLREKAQLEFRAESYNAFNHPQFSNPAAAVNSSSNFGVITSTTVAPRLIQFGMKYLF